MRLKSGDRGRGSWVLSSKEAERERERGDATDLEVII